MASKRKREPSGLTASAWGVLSTDTVAMTFGGAEFEANRSSVIRVAARLGLLARYVARALVAAEGFEPPTKGL